MCEFLSYIYNEQSWILWCAAFWVIGVLVIVIDYFQKETERHPVWRSVFGVFQP